MRQRYGAPGTAAGRGAVRTPSPGSGRPTVLDRHDMTNLSDGTPIVCDPRTGAAVTGTVPVVDLDADSVATTIDVVLHPTATLVHGRYLFVANTNSDSVSIIDTTSDEVVKSFGVEVFPHAPFGSSPSALALLDDHRLLVSLGRNDALGVYEPTQRRARR
jgi:YVTN family beta-propeller protein